MMGKYKESKSY